YIREEGVSRLLCPHAHRAQARPATLQQLLDDGLRRERGGVDAQRIRRTAQGGMLALLVPPVPTLDFGHDGRQRGSLAPLLQLPMTAPAPLFGARVEVELQVSVREHDGADVAPFEHDAAILTHRALGGDELLAHFGPGRHFGSPFADWLLTN